jgi:hypothetical protein
VDRSSILKFNLQYLLLQARLVFAQEKEHADEITSDVPSNLSVKDRPRISSTSSSAAPAKAPSSTGRRWRDMRISDNPPQGLGKGWRLQFSEILYVNWGGGCTHSEHESGMGSESGGVSSRRYSSRSGNVRKAPDCFLS